MPPVFANSTDLIRSLTEPLLGADVVQDTYGENGSEEDAMDTIEDVAVHLNPTAGRAEASEHLAALERLSLRTKEALARMSHPTAMTQTVGGTVEFGPIASHESEFSDEEWDGDAQETRVLSPEEPPYFALIYAWSDDDADTSMKANYRFIHHFVSEAGTPSAASMVACSAGIGVLNGARGGTTIPDDDRQGVFDHLARHLLDADREAPELLSVSDARVVAAAVESGLEVNPADHAEVLAALAMGCEMAANEIAALEVAESALTTVDAFGPEVALPALPEVTDGELIAELARRWAERTAEAVEDVASDDTEGKAETPIAEGADMTDTTVAEAGEAEVAEFAPEAESEGDGIEKEGIEEAELVADEVAEEAATFASDWEWEGVLIVEGLPSGDGRMIAEGALTWRELPIPLLNQTVNAPGHDGAIIAGSIQEIEREGQNIIGRGVFDSGEAGQEAKRLVTEGTMRGVSADIDSVVVEFVDPDGNAVDFEDLLFGDGDVLEVLVEGRIMGATLTPFPAFQEAHVTVIEDIASDAALVASGAEVLGGVWRVPSPIGMAVPGDMNLTHALDALVASGADIVEVPASPPREWFLAGDMAEPEPFRVHADGRCYGLIARWGTCHIGFSDRCVQVPRSGNAYGYFRNKTVLTGEGELVATGPIIMDTVHPNLRLAASDAHAFYADTGCAVADVAVYENEWGIVAAGAMRPGLTREQARRFRGSDVSPDWRTIAGRLEVVALLSVNASGFLVESLVASGAEIASARGVYDSVAGELRSLVAAGMVRHVETEATELRARLDAQDDRIAEILDAIRPYRLERAKAFAAKLVGADAEGSGCRCSP